MTDLLIHSSAETNGEIGVGRTSGVPRPPLSESDVELGTVQINSVRRVYGHGSSAVAARWRVPYLETGRVPERCRGVWVWQVHSAQYGRRTDSPTSGTVSVAGRVSVMFQEPALFPWLTVARNVELALQLDGAGRNERRARALELLALVRLESFAGHRPHQLSGGMRQRVALARALAEAGRCPVDG